MIPYLVAEQIPIIEPIANIIPNTGKIRLSTASPSAPELTDIKKYQQEYRLIVPSCLLHSEKHILKIFLTFTVSFSSPFLSYLLRPSSQNATALAAATFKESTPCDIGIITV